MACSIIRNKETNEIERVLAPNGKESILFDDILSLEEMEENKEAALVFWASVYTDQFKDEFGNWEEPLEGSEAFVGRVDENGEPLLSQIEDLLGDVPSQTLEEIISDERLFGPMIERPLEETAPSQPEELISQPVSTDSLDTKIVKFLEKIGVSVQSVDKIHDQFGNKIDAVAKASMLNKIIEVVRGAQSIDTLPEEAAHFFVEMLGPGHPLYKEMFDKITGYKIYAETVEQYKNKAAYRNADGSVNFDKLKKEAIGKVIAEHILKLEQGTESDAKINALMQWWNKLWKFIQDTFFTLENPFEQAASQILEADVSELRETELRDEEYYQLADPLGGIRLDQDRLTLDNTIDPRTGQKRHIYYYEGKPAKGSVTSVYVDRWLKKIFRDDQRSEAQKLIDLAKADYGDIVHEQIQDIIKSWTNADGTPKATQSPLGTKLPGPLYNPLNNYIREIIGQYDPNTVFMTEVKIYDKKTNIAGSIDLLVIQPDGTVDIYDWKSQEIAKDRTDIKEYKETMYRIQLEKYKEILSLEYGFKKFGKVRAIPIRTQFNYKNGEIYNLKSLEIGNINPQLISEEKSYLLPVTLRNETTGNQQLDALIDKLNGIYDKINNSSYTKDEIYKKREELGKLRLVIRDLQLRNRIDKLIDMGLTEFKKYTEKLDNKTLSGKDIQESLKILEVFSKSGVMLYDMREEYFETIKASNNKKAMEIYENVNKKFLLMTSRVSKLIEDIKEYRDAESKVLGEKNGIMKLLDPETAVGTIKGLFSSLSNITQSSFRLFSKMLRRVQNARDMKFEETGKKLSDLKTKFVKWASNKGLAPEKAMEMILNVDDKGNWNGNFLSKYRSEFYQGRKKAIETGNLKWITDNMEFDQEKYDAEEKRQIEFLKSMQLTYDEKENTELVNKKIKEWIESHKVVNTDGTLNAKALMNASNFFLSPNKDWFTDKWVNLNKPENAPLKEMYDYFQGLVRHAENLGMLDNKYKGSRGRKHTEFIPSVYAGKIESMAFGDIKNLMSKEGFFQNLEVDSGTRYTPEIDPTDGSIINRLPVYFTRDMGVKQEDGSMDYSKKSRDLFKVFGIWASHMYNYEAMQTIEDSSMMLLEAEKNKKSLVTDSFGNIIMENGRVKSVDNNNRNAKLLEEFVNFYLYDRLNGTFNDAKIKIPFIEKEYSLMKTIQSAMSYFSLKTLGLNVVSASSQFVGGTGNALFVAQKGIVFTKSTWATAMQMTAGSKKAQAALRYFNVMMEDPTRSMVDNLTLSGANRALSTDNAFVMQRFSDKAVQYPVAVALMLEHMVDENNNIVSIQETVKKEFNYNETYYDLSKSEREKMRKAIDDKVKKLKEEKSLLAVGKLTAEGEFEIGGIDKFSDTFADFRSKIKGVNKKILGNQSRDDVNGIRTTLLGSAFMQFRNWIPEMVEDRISGLQWDDELQGWSYGKFNAFFGDLFSKRMPQLLKAIITGFGDSAIELAKDKYQVLKREAYEKGEEFAITEGEFIDLYIGNLRSMIMELVVLTASAAAVMAVATSPDDDDEYKGFKKYASRALRKYFNEFAFYYNPTELIKLTSNPLPVIGLAEDMYKFVTAVASEGYGLATGDEELVEKAKPAKQGIKLFPVGKEFLLGAATLDDDFRKEWDIRLDNYFY